jgi:hypothetical protein
MSLNSVDEIWKPVRGYEGLYEVSNIGRVKSLPKPIRRTKSTYITKPKILALPVHESGYYRLNLRKDGKTKTRYVQNLVLEAFVSKRPRLQDADHIDKNIKNNRLSNLRWLPVLYNSGKVGYANPNTRIHQQRRNGRIKNGEMMPWTKLTSDQVVIIKKLLASGEGNLSISKKFNVTASTISGIKRGKSWQQIKI